MSSQSDDIICATIRSALEIFPTAMYGNDLGHCANNDFGEGNEWLAVLNKDCRLCKTFAGRDGEGGTTRSGGLNYSGVFTAIRTSRSYYCASISVVRERRRK
jgi:hypothetical protein